VLPAVLRHQGDEAYYEPVRRQNIWHNSRRKLAECGPRPGVDIKRRSCGGASGDVRWSSV
jgi:putative ABC transport system ATP-binding protein